MTSKQKDAAADVSWSKEANSEINNQEYSICVEEMKPRSESEIAEAIHQFHDKVWFVRHQSLYCEIAEGETRVVSSKVFDQAALDEKARLVTDTIWAQARQAAKRLEWRYGHENLGPWDDFEWGMINGKLSALRWVMGEDWDSLDT